MEIQSLQTFIRNEVTTPRLYFASHMDNRAKTIENITLKRNTIFSKVKSTQVDLNEPFLIATDEDNIYLIRNNAKNNFVSDYTSPYLTNSIIINVIFNNEAYGQFPENLKARLDSSSFIWYYFWFITSDRDITNITHNTCFQIEEMIKQILNKELTLYRPYETGVAINGLRARLATEKLVNMGGSNSRGINFRR